MQRFLALGLSVLALMLPASARAADDTAPLPKVDPAAIKSDIAEFASDEMNGRHFQSEEGKRAAQLLADNSASRLMRDGGPIAARPTPATVPRATTGLHARAQ